MWQKRLNALSYAGNFWAPRRKKNSEWFKNHAPRFYARLYEHMVRASDAMM